MISNFQKGQKVRYSADGRIGEILGRHRESGDRWAVCFDQCDIVWIPGEKLSLVNRRRSPEELFNEREFQSIDDYRRCLYRYRMSGELTNVIYSMDNAVAQFLPHQFIPVIKFLETYTERLLIADEVGLGKTLEAMYIWEELRARENAKRLLVVAPAVLREKWKGDIKKFFGIDAQIVSAENSSDSISVLERIKATREDPHKTAFALIVSLEGLRIARRVRHEMDVCRDVEKLFDLVVIDEAHYLRNHETETFKTGALLRDVARHLILLSATPIQTSSWNFFNLLNLLAPEDFDNRDTFNAQLLENQPLVNLANALERNDSAENVRQALGLVLSNEVFAHDADLLQLGEELDEIVSDVGRRVSMIDRIKAKFFYANLVTRSRKRDVFPNRTQRAVMSVNFKLNEEERAFYDEVTDYLRDEDKKKTKGCSNGGDKFSSFALIARQRQMASCIPAALAAWRGIGVDNDVDDELAGVEERVTSAAHPMPRFEKYSLERLEENDSKFHRVLKEIQGILRENPQEKIVVFSFFRNTVRYVHDYLKKNGIAVQMIMGGLTLEEKTRRIEAFRSTGVNVLVSSEVGSEGIDLQFARYELNYDLPWNPMRLEQRIGRIDRIGQASDKIFVCNAYCENTIEDRILAKLYNRIDVFRNTLGELEEILGEQLKDLEVSVFREDRELTDEEMEARIQQRINAICHEQKLRESLELEVGNMDSPYQSYVLQNIRRSAEANRLMTFSELMFFCKDVLEKRFEGSSIKPIANSSVADVRLSETARRELRKFVIEHPSSSSTQLEFAAAGSEGSRCNFGKKVLGEGCRMTIAEVIDSNHPLVKWLFDVVKKSAIDIVGCDVVCLARRDLPAGVDLATGCYAYAIQDWKSSGARCVNELRYYLMRGVSDSDSSNAMIGGYEAEKVLVQVLLKGQSVDVNLLNNEEYEACGMALEQLSQRMEADFDVFEKEQKQRNHDLIGEQSEYVKRTASRKASRIAELIDRMQSEGKSEGVLRMNRARRQKILDERDRCLEDLQDKLECSPEFSEVSLGILIVMED